MSSIQYCPKCLNDSLSINARGTISVIVNNKQMDSGRFLFNVGKQAKEQVLEDLEDKLENFFKWYGDFNNKEPITRVDIISGDFTCDQGCRLDLNYKAPVAGILFSNDELEEILNRLAEKYNLILDL